MAQSLACAEFEFSEHIFFWTTIATTFDAEFDYFVEVHLKEADNKKTKAKYFPFCSQFRIKDKPSSTGSFKKYNT